MNKPSILITVLASAMFVLCQPSAGHAADDAKLAAWKAQVEAAKAADIALLREWQARMTKLGLSQAGLKSIPDYGKPGEDPTNVMRFASSGPSDYGADIGECQMHIDILKSNIAAYDQELEKIKAEESQAGGGGDGGGGGGGCGC